MQHKDAKKNKFFVRRVIVLGGLKLGLASILVSKLAYLQLFKFSEFKNKSDKNRIRTLIDLPTRGIIKDKNGTIIADNLENYRLFFVINNRSISNIDYSLKLLVKLLNLNFLSQKLLKEKILLAKKKKLIQVLLIDNISWKNFSKIIVNKHELPYIHLKSNLIRTYLFPNATAHILGYVAPPLKKEINQYQEDLIFNPDFKVGRKALEKEFNTHLQGKHGIRKIETDAFNSNIRVLSDKKPISGKELILSIDVNIQNHAFELIKKNTGSIVIIDIKTGGIISMVSSPSFDNNKFTRGINREYWKTILNNNQKPLLNRAISSFYPPGSVFKLMVAITALRSNISTNYKVNCKGYYKLGNRIFRCWKEGGHGKLNMNDAISQSCNVYFYSIANIIDISLLADVSKNFGYNKKINIILPYKEKGNIPTPKWKNRHLNLPWVRGDALNVVIGQGSVLASPLQIALATARIAGGNLSLVPYLTKKSHKEKFIPNISIPDSHLDFIRSSMYQVVNQKNGTAYYHMKKKRKNFKIAGKTGTSQVVSSKSKNNKKMENHAIFTGFAPFHDPRYAMSIVMEHMGSGSKFAAPIAEDIFSRLNYS